MKIKMTNGASIESVTEKFSPQVPVGRTPQYYVPLTKDEWEEWWQRRGKMAKGTMMVRLADVVDVVTNLLSGSHFKALVLDILNNDIEKIPYIEGKWIWNERYAEFECSHCGGVVFEDVYDYCPHCGSKNEIQAKKEQTEITEEDLLELEHRFGKWVRYVVEDMLSGKNERWIEEGEEWNE